MKHLFCQVITIYYYMLLFSQYCHLSSVPPNVLDAESSPSTVTVRENYNASLICKAEGTPDPKITWRREDNKKIIIKRKKNAGKKGIFNATSLSKMLNIEFQRKERWWEKFWTLFAFPGQRWGHICVLPRMVFLPL